MFVVNLNGNLQDGTISEIGFTAGYNEGKTLDNAFERYLKDHFSDYKSPIKPIIAYTSNARLLQPQFSDGIPSASANHLVKGMIDKWGIFCGKEDNMYEYLKENYIKECAVK